MDFLFHNDEGYNSFVVNQNLTCIYAWIFYYRKLYFIQFYSKTINFYLSIISTQVDQPTIVVIG
ncbi:hypothetical protein D3C81_723080 [compost metagenome]